MTSATESNPRIYVACLAAYNNGYLHGVWIDADQDADADVCAIMGLFAMVEPGEDRIADGTALVQLRAAVETQDAGVEPPVPLRVHVAVDHDHAIVGLVDQVTLDERR